MPGSWPGRTSNLVDAYHLARCFVTEINTEFQGMDDNGSFKSWWRLHLSLQQNSMDRCIATDNIKTIISSPANISSVLSRKPR